MKDDKTTPAHDLTPRADSDVADSGSSSVGVDDRRRKLLKNTATATATAVVAVGLLPKKWQKPTIDAVGLPVHAQTSPAVATTAATTEATTTAATTEATTTAATTEATTTASTTLPRLPVITISVDRTSVVAGGSATIILRADRVLSDNLDIGLSVTDGDRPSKYGTKEDGGDYTVGAFHRPADGEIKSGQSENSLELRTSDDDDTGTGTVVIRIRDRSSYTVGGDSEVTVTILPRPTATAATTTTASTTTAATTTAAPTTTPMPDFLASIFASELTISLASNSSFNVTARLEPVDKTLTTLPAAVTLPLDVKRNDGGGPNFALPDPPSVTFAAGTRFTRSGTDVFADMAFTITLTSGGNQFRVVEIGFDTLPAGVGLGSPSQVGFLLEP